MTARARTNTPQGAVAYAQYWIRTLDWAYATMDSSLARTAFSAACTDCDRFLTNVIDRVRAEGQHYVGGRLWIREVTLAGTTTAHRSETRAVDVGLQQTAIRRIDSSGKTIRKTPADPNAYFRTWLRWSAPAERWAIVEWKEVEWR